MKLVWIIIGCIMIVGAAALLLPTAERASTITPRFTSEVAAVVSKPAVAAVTPALSATVGISTAKSVSTPKSVSAADVKSPTQKTAATAPLTAPPPGGLTLGLDRTIANAVIAPGAIMRQPDGSILADGKYRIEGDGTHENPYRVGWDCLASAGKTYIPRLKENLLPQRVAMLDGAWIRVEGYVAFPLMLQESSEILAMLNQWDGCCIGVPPTPYDALEVKLLEPVKPGKRHTFNFGTVTGRFKVDPLLVENWLVGLYQLDEATLTQSGM